MKLSTFSYRLGQRFTDAEARTFMIVGLTSEGTTGIMMEFVTDEGYSIYVDADYESARLTQIDIREEKLNRVFRKPVSLMNELFNEKKLINL